MATATPKIEPRLIPLLAAMPAATLEQFAEMGAGYFNPLLGDTHQHTLARIAEVSSFLADSLYKDCASECRDGMALVAEMIWRAAQSASMASLKEVQS